MRKPRPEAFDPNLSKRRPDPIQLDGMAPLLPRSLVQQSVYDAASAVSVKPEGSAQNPAPTPERGVPGQSFPGISPEVMKIVRKAVKEFGKEAATHRFTEAEKNIFTEIIFNYRKQGIRTSENELTRIAINYLFQDYQRNGEQSVLHQLLQALNE